jgi:hypothetical protein
VAHFQRAMMIDIDQAAKAMKEAEIEDLLEGFNQPTYRGLQGQWPAGRYLVVSNMGCQGTAGPMREWVH